MSSIDSFSHLFPYINQKFIKCEQILSLIGFYCVCKISAKLLYKLLNTSYVHFWSRIRQNNVFNRSNGWAIITFATNGSGISVAKQLAIRRFNLILIDDNEDNLNHISNELLSEFRVEVMTITTDLSKGLKSLELIESHIKDKEIIVLVNNVLLINPLTDNYLNLSSHEIYDLLNTKIGSVVALSSMVLPQMQRLRNGFIINISSLLAIKATPYWPLECAANAFVDRFSTALSYECKEYGITVQSLMPSFCSNQSITGLIAPTHQTYANCAINTIGSTDRTTGYLWHEFHYLLLSSCPQFFWSFTSDYSRNCIKSYFISN